MFGSRQSSSSDSTCSISSAAEHSYYMEELCVATANVGLPKESARINVGLSEPDHIVFIQGAAEHVEGVSMLLPKESARINVGLSGPDQIFLIQSVAEHAEGVSMLICNTHPPSSKKRSFTSKERIKCCEHVLRHAISAHSARPNNVGIVLGGDVNVSRSLAHAALQSTLS